MKNEYWYIEYDLYFDRQFEIEIFILIKEFHSI